jgi:hypothetical protein
VTRLGEVLLRAGEHDEARAETRRAWDGLRRVLGDAHPSTISVGSQLGSVLAAREWPAADRALAAELVRSLRDASDDPGLGAAELNDVATLLLSVRPPDLADPRAAHRLAARACEMERAAGGGDLWKYLDTLAAAQHARGAAQDAVATQEEALRLAPADHPRRAEIEDNLRRYRSGA